MKSRASSISKRYFVQINTNRTFSRINATSRKLNLHKFVSFNSLIQLMMCALYLSLSFFRLFHPTISVGGYRWSTWTSDPYLHRRAQKISDKRFRCRRPFAAGMQCHNFKRHYQRPVILTILQNCLTSFITQCTIFKHIGDISCFKLKIVLQGECVTFGSRIFTKLQDRVLEYKKNIDPLFQDLLLQALLFEICAMFILKFVNVGRTSFILYNLKVMRNQRQCTKINENSRNFFCAHYLYVYLLAPLYLLFRRLLHLFLRLSSPPGTERHYYKGRARMRILAASAAPSAGGWRARLHARVQNATGRVAAQSYHPRECDKYLYIDIRSVQSQCCVYCIDVERGRRQSSAARKKEQTKAREGQIKKREGKRDVVLQGLVEE